MKGYQLTAVLAKAGLRNKFWALGNSIDLHIGGENRY